MSRKPKNVCVIGAGASGLIAMKELLDEGHRVCCFEKYDKLGGVFNYSDYKGGVYDSTVLTVSNYFMAYSCFPPISDEKRLYWNRQEYADYLYAFVEHFSINQYINFNKEIVSVKRQDDGEYSVSVIQSGEPSQITSHCFDAVAVCSGNQQIPRVIEIAGKENFKGEIFHSARYKNAEAFKDKRVLCVGLGETGADVSHEIAQVAKTCVLSLRHYHSIVERFPYGREHPNDAYTSYALYSIPTKLQNSLANLQLLGMEKFSKKEEIKEYAKWNRKAGHFFNHFFTKTEVFFKSIVEKKLDVNSSGIQHLEANKVFFNDGRTEAIDVIMLNTGYVDQFPFIKDVEITDVRQLYKHMIHPELGADVAFIGWARPGVGGVPACSEMQSRYFSLLCSDILQLPSKNGLAQIIQKHSTFEDQIYFKNPNVRSLVHYSTYMHDFAKIIGCSPWRIATFLNPRLLYKVWFGSQLPSIYRLYGPHSSVKQAKDTIYKLPVAINLAEQLIFTIFSIFSAIMAKLKMITPAPRY